MEQELALHPMLQQAMELGGLTPQQAWDLECLMLAGWQPSRDEQRLVAWVNHLNCPSELLTLQ